MTTPSTTDVQRAQAVLSSPALIRLITEIDDNGPIPPRALTRTLTDVPEDHLRHSADQARLLGLVHVQPGAGLSLTTAGEELAYVYDALARWARRHEHPAPVCDFADTDPETSQPMDDIDALLAVARHPPRQRARPSHPERAFA
ncbi:regulator [Streptomyces sp. NPDC002814]